jgi:hypothetical protein
LGSDIANFYPKSSACDITCDEDLASARTSLQSRLARGDFVARYDFDRDFSREIAMSILARGLLKAAHGYEVEGEKIQEV